MEREPTFYFRFHDDVECIPHLHAAAELIYVVRGNALIHIGNEPYRLRQGEAVLALPYEIHDIHTVGSSRILVSEFSTELVRAFAQTVQNKYVQRRNFCPDPDGMRYVLRTAEREPLVCEREACLYFICAEFLRGNELSDRAATPAKSGVYEAIAYINEHYGEQFTLRTLADKIGYSYGYLSKIFLEEFGIGFAKYVNNYRLQKAIYRLLNTDDSVTEIALESGFGCIRSFNRIFMDATGVSPTDFRKQNQKGFYSL